MKFFAVNNLHKTWFMEFLCLMLYSAVFWPRNNGDDAVHMLGQGYVKLLTG
jgi:hypothetical protein